MSDLLKSQTYLLILSVLQSGPAHGYALIEEIKSRSAGRFDLPEGTLYPALHRLEAQGLLESYWGEAEGRRRRVYKLTAPGLAASAARRADWSQFTRAMQAVIGGGA